MGRRWVCLLGTRRCDGGVGVGEDGVGVEVEGGCVGGEEVVGLEGKRVVGVAYEVDVVDVVDVIGNGVVVQTRMSS